LRGVGNEKSKAAEPLNKKNNTTSKTRSFYAVIFHVTYFLERSWKFKNLDPKDCINN